MSSSQQAGIEGFITTHNLSSLSATWNGERWLVVVSRGDALSWRRAGSLKEALLGAVDDLGKGANPSRSGTV